MNDLDLTERLDRARERLRDDHQTVADPLLDANDAAAVLKISAYTVRQPGVAGGCLSWPGASRRTVASLAA